MTRAVKIEMFGGMVPRLGVRNLPDGAAQVARNAKLLSGELRAWNGLLPLSPVDPTEPVTVFHFEYLSGDYFMSFSELTWVANSPLLNDAQERIYWTNSTGVWQNTKPRIIAGDPPYKVGVPAPTGALTGSTAGGTPALAETRIYAATYITGFGEEGPPSSSLTLTGNADGTWTINGLNALAPPAGTWDNLTKLRLYRTITTETGVDFRQVNEWTLGTRPASYNDTLTNTEVSVAPVLESYSWEPPPEGMTGLTVASGFMVGFVDRRVYASVPYRPWAWPTEYQVGVEDDVVALGAYGSTVVVGTTGNPYIIVGATPDAVSLQRLKAVLPCVSPGSLVSTVGSVIYASENGLVSISDAGVDIITKSHLTRDEWLRDYSPRTIKAAVFQDRYIAYHSQTDGFMLGFDDPSTALTRLSGVGVTSVNTSALTGQAMIGVGSVVYAFDDDTATRAVYTWKSKPFQLPKPANFGVLQLRGTFTIDITTDPGTGGGTADSIGSMFNAGMFNASLLNSSAEVGSGPAPPAPDPTPTLSPIAVKVYGDNVLRWTGLVSDERPVRLPSGFKCTYWEVEVSGSAPLASIVLAATGKALEVVP